MDLMCMKTNNDVEGLPHRLNRTTLLFDVILRLLHKDTCYNTDPSQFSLSHPKNRPVLWPHALALGIYYDLDLQGTYQLCLN